MEPDKCSEQGKQLEEVISRLNQLYSEGVKDTVITLPGVFGKQRNETFITAWLAYLLNPDVNGIGVTTLNALLRCYEKQSGRETEGLLITDAEQIVVETEYTFAESGRRIDLLITTESYVIGIENKIDAGEHGDQTCDYWQGFKTLCGFDRGSKSQKLIKTKKAIAIYLTPEANTCKPTCHNFVKITYTDWLHQLQEIPPDPTRSQRKDFIFTEFLLYVEEELMSKSKTGFPEMKEDVHLYHKNRVFLEKAKKDYDDYYKKLSTWLGEQLNAIDGGFHAGLIQSEYWQMWENPDWKDIVFHFELNWRKTQKRLLEITEDDEVWLYAHIESKDKSITDCFSNYRGKNELVEKKVKVNFSDETKARESLVTITKLLRTSDYRDAAEEANKCLETRKQRAILQAAQYAEK